MQRFRRFTPNTLDDATGSPGFPGLGFIRLCPGQNSDSSSLRSQSTQTNRAGGGDRAQSRIHGWLQSSRRRRRASAFNNAHSFVSGVNSTWDCHCIARPRSSLSLSLSLSLPFFTLFPLNCDGSADLQFRPFRQRFTRPLQQRQRRRQRGRRLGHQNQR